MGCRVGEYSYNGFLNGRDRQWLAFSHIVIHFDGIGGDVQVFHFQLYDCTAARLFKIEKAYIKQAICIRFEPKSFFTNGREMMREGVSHSDGTKGIMFQPDDSSFPFEMLDGARQVLDYRLCLVNVFIIFVFAVYRVGGNAEG